MTGISFHRFLLAIFSNAAIVGLIAGNGSISGVDVASLVIIVASFGLFLVPPTRGTACFLIVIWLSVAALVLCSYRAFTTPELTGYWLWPIKAVFSLLAYPLLCRNSRMLTGGLLFITCLVIASTTSIQDGRAYGVFGPNMLYRFFCMSLALSLFYLAQFKTNSLIGIIAASISFFLIVLAGSVGGLLIALILYLLIFRISVKWISILIILSVAIIFGGGFEDVSVFQRLLFKFRAGFFENNIRFSGVSDIIESGFSITGRSYSAFSSVWSEGYFYPHNIFVELIYFFGLPGLILCGFMAYGLILSCRAVYTRKGVVPLDFLTIVLILASSLSGDLSDNYAAVSVGVLSAARGFRNFRSRNFFYIDGSRATQQLLGDRVGKV